MKLPAVQVNPDELLVVVDDEVLEVAKRLTENKTSGLNGIQKITFKDAAGAAPGHQRRSVPRAIEATKAITHSKVR